jgi:hypothetical protein
LPGSSRGELNSGVHTTSLGREAYGLLRRVEDSAVRRSWVFGLGWGGLMCRAHESELRALRRALSVRAEEVVAEATRGGGEGGGVVEASEVTGALLLAVARGREELALATVEAEGMREEVRRWSTHSGSSRRMMVLTVRTGAERDSSGNAASMPGFPLARGSCLGRRACPHAQAGYPSSGVPPAASRASSTHIIRCGGGRRSRRARPAGGRSWRRSGTAG